MSLSYINLFVLFNAKAIFVEKTEVVLINSYLGDKIFIPFPWVLVQKGT